MQKVLSIKPLIFLLFSVSVLIVLFSKQALEEQMNSVHKEINAPNATIEEINEKAKKLDSLNKEYSKYYE